MRIAVTGATGNVGSAVVRRLLAHGHEVVGVARRTPPEPGEVTWVRADLAADCAAELAQAFADTDAVVHLVWGFQPTHRIDYLAELGVGGTRRVLDAVVAAGVPHLIHQSSIGAYSPRRGLEPVAENWPTGGIAASPYSRHKAAAERLLDDFEQQTGVVVSRTRPGIIGQHSAGSGQLRYFLPTVVPARAVGHLPVLPLYRDFTLQVVHADDVAAAITAIAEGRVPGPFNLVADPVLTREDLAAVLGARAVHLPFPVLRAAADLAWRAQIPVNRPHTEVNDMFRDGFHQHAVHAGVAPYKPNSLDGGCPFHASADVDGSFEHLAVRVAESTKVRDTSHLADAVSFDDHFTQVRLFWLSMTPVEQEHIIRAYSFELGKCYEQAVKDVSCSAWPTSTRGCARRSRRRWACRRRRRRSSSWTRSRARRCPRSGRPGRPTAGWSASWWTPTATSPAWTRSAPPSSRRGWSRW